jgi:hypothetical protein
VRKEKGRSAIMADRPHTQTAGHYSSEVILMAKASNGQDNLSKSSNNSLQLPEQDVRESQKHTINTNDPGKLLPVGRYQGQRAL